VDGLRESFARPETAHDLSESLAVRVGQHSGLGWRQAVKGNDSERTPIRSDSFAASEVIMWLLHFRRNGSAVMRDLHGGAIYRFHRKHLVCR
jgi:hypothetical protein